MQKKKQKGITLIALIVSIVVMLILGAVTINLIFEGKIIDKTSEAAWRTGKEAVNESNVLNEASEKISKAVEGENQKNQEEEDNQGSNTEEPIVYPTLIEELIELENYKGKYVAYLNPNGETYKDSNGDEILWRILIIDTDENSNQFVKLISHNTVFDFYHGYSATSSLDILSNPNADNFDIRFNLLKNSDYADKVISITREDINKFYGAFQADSTIITGDILALNKAYFLATGGSTGMYICFIRHTNAVRSSAIAVTYGVRPVIYLKSSIKVIDRRWVNK
jgi:hypothetical protein